MKSYEKSVKSLDEIQRFRNPYTFLGVGDPWLQLDDGLARETKVLPRDGVT